MLEEGVLNKIHQSTLNLMEGKQRCEANFLKPLWPEKKEKENILKQKP